jgi:phosphoribosyl-AMP cyclohydrolase
MSELRELYSADQLDYTKLIEPKTGEPIVPVVCIDGLKMARQGLLAYRMQGFANEAAIEKTLATRQATFYSRTRSGLWTKGEESGNFLIVRAAFTDCDADSVLLDVSAAGPSCHTGAETCFVEPSEQGET